MRRLITNLLLALLCLASPLLAQDMRMDTYCNPLNVDYTYMIYNSSKDISYRSGADPAVVEFRGEYYMFVTRTHGYWHSTDLQNWNFINPGENWYPQGCNAPAAHNYKDSVLYVCGDPSGVMSVLYTDNPKSGNWKATPAIITNLQDPDLFLDDDGLHVLGLFQQVAHSRHEAQQEPSFHTRRREAGTFQSRPRETWLGTFWRKSCRYRAGRLYRRTVVDKAQREVLHAICCSGHSVQCICRWCICGRPSDGTLYLSET